jgi:hypothetical protein
MFGQPLNLNFNGENNYKTEFGGLIFLIVAVTSITLTIVYMFPNGFVVNSVISEYSLQQSDNGEGMTMFDNTDTAFRIFVANTTTN